MTARPIYLDYNATTPIDEAVVAAMMPYLTERYGNPSSSHAYGLAARRGVEEGRAQVAALVGARPEEIVFTSGASESNNSVLRGLASMARGRGGHLIVSAVEHPSILEPCAALEAEGFRVTRVGVDSVGRVAPADVERALTAETILVSVMHANNEVGTIQEVAEIAALARRHGVPFHTDAAQTAGKIEVDVDEIGADFLSLAGHKLYAPKGVGALYIRSGLSLPALILGAGHEMGRRSGTENVAGIAGFGAACARAAEHLAEATSRIHRLKERLFEGLRRAHPGLRRNGDPERSLPNTLSVSFRGLPASTMLAEIGDRLAASSGAACHSDGVRLSAVMKAMNVPVEEAMGTVRLSLGRPTTEAEIDEAVAILAEAVPRFRPARG